MATINLRPWREERRERLLKEFLQLTMLVGFFALGVWLGWKLVVDGQIEYQKSRNNLLQYFSLNITLNIQNDFQK